METFRKLEYYHNRVLRLRWATVREAIGCCVDRMAVIEVGEIFGKLGIFCYAIAGGGVELVHYGNFSEVGLGR